MNAIKEICDSIHNYFVKDTIHGRFSIENGTLDTSGIRILEGQYFQIKGSVLNDGIYKHPEFSLKDEEFHGAIYLLAIPADIIAIAEEIETWESENGKALASPYQSESFADYNYTRASSASGGQFTWRDVFKSKLDQYRKIG